MTNHRVQKEWQGECSSGFTLLEILVVLAILSLCAGIVVARLRPPPDGIRLEAAARELIGALRLTRSAAIAQNLELGLAIDVIPKTFGSAVVPTTRFDRDISVEVVFASSKARGLTPGSFVFFPDGSSSGGEVLLGLGGRQTRIAINWLSGEALPETGTNGAPR